MWEKTNGWALAVSLTLAAVPLGAGEPRLAGFPKVAPGTVIRAAPAATCQLLDDKPRAALLDGLWWNLVWSCGRYDLIGWPREEGSEPVVANKALLLETDVRVNDTAGEQPPDSRTQSETTIARNENNGLLCSAFNDSWEYFSGGGGFTGFARSPGGGFQWEDRGAVGGVSMGDPSMVWRRQDGKFYLATLSSGGGLALWRSDDDCQSFQQISTPSTGGDDKEMLAVDNTPTSPYYGRLYLAWTDFGEPNFPIRLRYSTDGGLTWSLPTRLTNTEIVQGAWLAVAPDGIVYASWVEYASLPDGNISIRLARSGDGGANFVPSASPLVNAVSPRDAQATAFCGRPALKGKIRYLASPQLAVTSDGLLHVVYSRDPSPFNSGDVVNVYYRRSIDRGVTWKAEQKVNGDTTTRDQFLPSIQASGTRYLITWYDRRRDVGNLDYEVYTTACDTATGFCETNQRVSDNKSPVVLDPSLAPCYHGDYDQSVLVPFGHVVQWVGDQGGSQDVWSNPPN